jgi:NADH dehydrogenase (ubiquinone) 1 alpha subcomplex subunit 12
MKGLYVPPNFFKKWFDIFKEMKRVGLKETMKRLYRMSEFKSGRLVGIDQFGNKYYEDEKEQYGHDRWIDYANPECDPTQIPAEWHAWLHRVTDKKGNELQQFIPKYRRLHEPNYTGTPKAYYPPTHLMKKINEIQLSSKQEDKRKS